VNDGEADAITKIFTACEGEGTREHGLGSEEIGIVEHGPLAGLPIDGIGVYVGRQVAAMKLDEMAGLGWGEFREDYIKREVLAAQGAVSENVAEDLSAAVIRSGSLLGGDGGQNFAPGSKPALAGCGSTERAEVR